MGVRGDGPESLTAVLLSVDGVGLSRKEKMGTGSERPVLVRFERVRKQLREPREGTCGNKGEDAIQRHSLTSYVNSSLFPLSHSQQPTMSRPRQNYNDISEDRPSTNYGHGDRGRAYGGDSRGGGGGGRGGGGGGGGGGRGLQQ